MIHVTYFAISITVYARFSRRINSKKVEFGQEELMDHIMVSINLGSKQPDWEISGTRLLSGQMMGDVTINIRGFFLPL